MKVRATIEFDVRFDENDFTDIEALMNYHLNNGFINVRDPKASFAYEIKQLLEHEHLGMAEYKSASVTNVEIIGEK